MDTMNPTAVLQTIAEALEEIGVDGAAGALAHDPEVTFTELSVDSLGLMEVVAHVEETYLVEIGDEFADLDSPADLVHVLCRQPAGVS
jgi:acyl carrier protein